MKLHCYEVLNSFTVLFLKLSYKIKKKVYFNLFLSQLLSNFWIYQVRKRKTKYRNVTYIRDCYTMNYVKGKFAYIFFFLLTANPEGKGNAEETIQQNSVELKQKKKKRLYLWKLQWANNDVFSINIQVAHSSYMDKFIEFSRITKVLFLPKWNCMVWFDSLTSMICWNIVPKINCLWIELWTYEIVDI